jgi:hypothetical protein
MKITNPENESRIIGEAGDNIGRGGRSSIYFMDEAAFYNRPMLIDAALSQNSDVKINVSTPNGIGNPFYRKRHSGKIPVFIFDWRSDPRKDDEWYQKQKEILDPIIVAQEIDRDYGASLEGVCIPAMWVQAAIDLKLPAEGQKVAALDVADEGPDTNALILRHGVVVKYIDSWQRGNTAQTTKKAAFVCKEKGYNILRYDSIGVGAGVKGELSNKGYEKIKGIPINSGASTVGSFYVPGKRNKDMFSNLRAQAWWLMRRRFEKTYEHVNGIKKHLVDELISIPNHAQLISEISMPTYSHTDSGKIKIESKESMARRGIKSPNHADCLIIAFCPVKQYAPTKQKYIR